MRRSLYYSDSDGYFGNVSILISTVQDSFCAVDICVSHILWAGLLVAEGA